MSGRANAAFEENSSDIDRLLGIHATIGGDGDGRRWNLEVLNKSAIVLITAVWEAYCEDVIAEGLQHLVTHASSPEALPKELRKKIAEELSAEQHGLTVWNLAGEGWRDVLKARMVGFAKERNRKFNTPKSRPINNLFLNGIGIKAISSSWVWQGMSKESAEAKLDKFVELRGSVAHRGASSESVHKKHVRDYYEHVKRLVETTDATVNELASIRHAETVKN
jgi:hypothetical protein